MLSCKKMIEKRLLNRYKTRSKKGTPLAITHPKSAVI